MPKFFLLLALLTGCATSTSSLTRTPASATVQFVPGTGYAAAVTPFLESATTSIDIAQFNFDSKSAFTKSLADELIHIKQGFRNNPNFRIRVLLEAKLFGADTKNPATVAYLQQNGIETHLVTGLVVAGKQVGIEHGKIVVVDGHKILAGSTNWTDTSILRNNETNLIVDSPKFGATLGQYFDTLVQNSGVMHPSTTVDGNIQMYTDTAYFDSLIGFLKTAQSGDRLDCSMYLFNVNDKTDPNDRAGKIMSALIAAKTRGTNVRVMMETAAGSFGAFIVQANSLAAKQLLQGGISQVYFDLPSKISHMKFCVLTHGNMRSVSMGSSNWNFLDLDENHQLNWQINNAGAVGDQLFSFFDNIVKTEGTLQK